MTLPSPDSPDAGPIAQTDRADGRRERSKSSRAKIIAAMLELVERGDVQPSAARVADHAGVERDRAQCGAVTLIQRFGSALNLNVHCHMLWLDGVYDRSAEAAPRKPRLHRACAPSPADLTALAGAIAHRVCRHLVRRGWLEGEGESAFLTDGAGGEDAMDALRMSSITYRIATGPHAGRKVATLQTLPADAHALQGDAGQVGGFSLHAGVVAQAHERDKLERLCRYITRPAIAERRLSISPQGRVRYELKTPWRNGTTHVEFEPIDFIAKLAALVPPPRAHLTRFHGIFAHKHVRLPFVEWHVLIGVGCFDVINSGQITVTTVVIHRKGG
jgi:hypothetical protein